MKNNKSVGKKHIRKQLQFRKQKFEQITLWYYLQFYDYNKKIDYLFVSEEKVNAVKGFTYKFVNKMVACFHEIR